jgi:phosphodiesterase/alkaline phosphatase D-like protein
MNGDAVMRGGQDETAGLISHSSERLIFAAGDFHQEVAGGRQMDTEDLDDGTIAVGEPAEMTAESINEGTPGPDRQAMRFERVVHGGLTFALPGGWGLP